MSNKTWQEHRCSAPLQQPDLEQLRQKVVAQWVSSITPAVYQMLSDWDAQKGAFFENASLDYGMRVERWDEYGVGLYAKILEHLHEHGLMDLQSNQIQLNGMQHWLKMSHGGKTLAEQNAKRYRSTAAFKQQDRQREPNGQWVQVNRWQQDPMGIRAMDWFGCLETSIRTAHEKSIRSLVQGQVFAKSRYKIIYTDDTVCEPAAKGILGLVSRAKLYYLTHTAKSRIDFAHKNMLHMLGSWMDFHVSVMLTCQAQKTLGLGSSEGLSSKGGSDTTSGTDADCFALEALQNGLMGRAYLANWQARLMDQTLTRAAVNAGAHMQLDVNGAQFRKTKRL